MAKKQPVKSSVPAVIPGRLAVFISWSGERSKAVASALKKWLPLVFQDIEPWMSSHDIQAGERGMGKIAEELDGANLGILCLTPENVNAPWVIFEAGALSKSLDHSRVIPYRLELKTTDVAGPLSQFQSVEADEEGTFKLISSINQVYPASLPVDRLSDLYSALWPHLEALLNNMPASQNLKKERSEREMIEEILGLVRAADQHVKQKIRTTPKNRDSGMLDPETLRTLDNWLGKDSKELNQSIKGMSLKMLEERMIMFEQFCDLEFGGDQIRQLLEKVRDEYNSRLK